MSVTYMLELASEEIDTLQAALLDYEPVDGKAAEVAEALMARLLEFCDARDV